MALLYSAANKAENDPYHWERRLVHNTVMLWNALYIVKKTWKLTKKANGSRPATMSSYEFLQLQKEAKIFEMCCIQVKIIEA